MKILSVRVLLTCMICFYWLTPLKMDAEVSETIYKSRRSLVLKNESATLVIDIAGGALRDFQLSDVKVNPLNWGWKPQDQAPLDERPRTMGHFLCLDRWGPPSKAEGENGMPYHGEAAKVTWEVESFGGNGQERFSSAMKAKLPMAGLSIQRHVQIARNAPYVLVSETVTNDNPLGRIFNMVQHPSIGPPFLNEKTVVDCNGTIGFSQDGKMPTPENPSFHWPRALKEDGAGVDMRGLTDDDVPNVVSYVVDDSYGWVTAFSPDSGILIGYIWKSADYPWIDLWRRVRDGKPDARGLEFGTTGLHQPFPILTKKLTIFDRPLFEFLDTGETTTKSYGVFMTKVPDGFQGVGTIHISGTQLEIKERNANQDKGLVMEIGNLAP